jgi:hypothetical protein
MKLSFFFCVVGWESSFVAAEEVAESDMCNLLALFTTHRTFLTLDDDDDDARKERGDVVAIFAGEEKPYPE